MTAGAHDPADPADGTSLCARIRALIAQTRLACPAGPIAAALDAVQARLAEPTLRIAVGGRMKAGKSTLINALVGQRIAASAATECTVLVSWFRYGPQNRIDVRLRDGGEVAVPGRPGGGVPDRLDSLRVPFAEIRDLRVSVTNERLRTDYTIIDTPGMGSLSGLDDAAMAALTGADALLYAMPLPADGDAAALEALRRAAPASMTAANVIGVLSRIDQLGDGRGDPWPAARTVAARNSRRLRGLVRITVPVIGLLGEAAGDWEDEDTALVRRLVGADPVDLEEAVTSVGDLMDWDDGPLSSAERGRLVRMLGGYGVVRAVDTVRSGGGTDAIRAALYDASGVAELVTHVRTDLLAAADRLRAAAALHRLETLHRATPPGPAGDVLATLLARTTDVRADPQLRQALLSAALSDLAADRLDLDDGDATALVALATGNTAPECLGLPSTATAPEIAAAADRAIARWRRLEASSNRTVARHARTALEASQALYFRA